MRDIPKAVIITLFGLYEFLIMCFGLRNEVQSFQRLVNIVLFAFAYVCNIYTYITSITYIYAYQINIIMDVGFVNSVLHMQVLWS